MMIGLTSQMLKHALLHIGGGKPIGVKVERCVIARRLEATELFGVEPAGKLVLTPGGDRGGAGIKEDQAVGRAAMPPQLRHDRVFLCHGSRCVAQTLKLFDQRTFAAATRPDYHDHHTTITRAQRTAGIRSLRAAPYLQSYPVGDWHRT